MKKAIGAAGIFFLIIELVIILSASNFLQATSSTLTADVISKRATVASLSASAVKLKLDQLVGIAQLYTEYEPLRQNVLHGRWDEALGNIEKVLSTDPSYYSYFIDRMVLVDREGKIRVDFPKLFESPQSDVTFPEWRGPIIQQNQGSYVTNVYERQGRYSHVNFVEVVVPFKAADGSVPAVFALQIPINEFSDFAKDLELGSTGFAYFVDRTGHLITHPKFSSINFVDFSSVPTVQAAMRHEAGAGIYYNPIEKQTRVAAIENVPEYGWGVISVEPYDEAFQYRDHIMSQIWLMAILATVANLSVAFLLAVLLLKIKFKKQKISGQRRGFTLIELLVVIAIIAILAVVVVLALNPGELLRQSRDSTRISDLNTIKSALALYVADSVGAPNLASSTFGYNACYLSAISGSGTTSTRCGVFSGASLTANVSTTKAAYRNVDSTGWIPVAFSSISFKTPFAVLPVDPVNNATYYYSYAASSSGVFEIDAFMESQRYGSGGAKDIVQTDTGDNSSTYEVGTSLIL
jgi:prepilin-type N-terminal cleavage/methylation domain-containing protein